MNAKWCRLRAETHHNWLKNEFLRRLEAFVLRAQQEVERERAAEFLLDYWGQWRERFTDCRKIVLDADDALSPRQLFLMYPLSGCDADTQHWLPDIIHGLYLLRTRIREQIDKAGAALSAAQAQYQRLDAHLAGVNISDSLEFAQIHIDAIKQFESHVRLFSRCISDLPHAIQVV